ncbi:restriction endonuclease subunit S [Acinetobacter johnsonii]|uniref:restriction endonuclease subunit S n=1 Tax=Acinetobacter johnsonii TaxID=40214 RepID=UPI002449B609|nr:restriction endonuclease subunit S [Acinetobacter johnsonii]MDH1364335.1 restriction endonuclease subunit S [Acinetobacter johnsonii]
MEKQKCPELRFSEFKNYWNEIRLGDVIDNFSYGLNAQAVKYDGKHKYIRITDIDDNSRSFLQDNLTSPDIDFEKADNYILKKKDILFARTGASVGKTYLYNETDGLVYFAGFLIRGKIKNDIDEAFIFANTQTERFHKFIRLTSQRSGQPGINAKEYTSFEFYCSDFQEQVKIGEFFKNLDESIVLHEKKLVQTQNLKKAMLEKMFPKQGSNRPEIRLKGFSRDWEPFTLGSLCHIGDIDHRMPESREQGIPYLMTGDFIGINELDFRNAKRISNEDYEQLAKKIKPEAGDILFARYASVGTVRYVKTHLKFLISYSCAILKTSVNSNGEYLFYYLQTKCSKNQIEQEINTGSQRNIGIDSLKKLSILMPKDDEQRAIADFFRKIDENLVLQEKQLQTLKNLKQALLEKMFV